MDYYGHHDAEDCLVGHLDMQEACSLSIRLPSEQFCCMGPRVHEVVYHLLCRIVITGVAPHVVLPHPCGKSAFSSDKLRWFGSGTAAISLVYIYYDRVA